jgi:hypothetical protein
MTLVARTAMNTMVILVAHAAALAVIYFLLLAGDAMFSSYAILMRESIFVSSVAQVGLLQRMGSELRLATAGIVGLSAVLQIVLFAWRR